MKINFLSYPEITLAISDSFVYIFLMKTWLKGGLIGIGVWLVIVIFLLIYCLSGFCREMACAGCALLFAVPQNPIMWFGVFNSLAMHFGIGALIGLIIGKIKNQK